MYFRTATREDSLSILSIYKEAIAFMREHHNPTQWSDFESLKRTVLKDIEKKESFVLIDKDEIQAVFTLQTEIEPTYLKINGQWKDNSSYVTVHKLAVKTHNKGYASLCFDYVFSIYSHVRVDTHEDNLPMQKTIEKAGFSYCGIITLLDGSSRLAYERSLSFEDSLLLWYKAHKRDFPWRKSKDPYLIWISEIMLQQTRAETVKPYYQNFIGTLPTLDDLANCDEDVYLKLWQGLGYYSRVRNLHKAANEIKYKHHGVFPKEEKELLSLPGIGSYTAHAILSIAFDQPYIAVDGNLIRIFARLTKSSLEKNSKEMKETCETYFLSRLKSNPSDMNQALMDLGELICLPHGQCHCEICPLRRECLSYQDQSMLSYPVHVKEKKKRIEKRTVLVLKYLDKYAIVKRPEQGLLASLYEFINLERRISKKEIIIRYPEAIVSPLGSYRHVFSHLVWELNGYQVELKKLPKESYLWVTYEELETKYSLPAAFLFYQKKIRK